MLFSFFFGLFLSRYNLEFEELVMYFRFQREYGVTDYPDVTRNENMLDLYSGSFVNDVPAFVGEGKFASQNYDLFRFIFKIYIGSNESA